MEDTERQRGEEMEATEKQVINFHLDRNADCRSKSDLYAHTSPICQSCRSLGTDLVCVHVVLCKGETLPSYLREADSKLTTEYLDVLDQDPSCVLLFCFCSLHLSLFHLFLLQ